ncbi:MAG: MFS transporter [Anaerolineae bacterium]|nr:MFS transporter [Anaerolineae bacterium]
MSRLQAFLIIWAGQAVSLFGSRLAQFALIWWLTKTTESPTILALATMVGLLPQVLLGPIVGVLVDRWSRRAIMLVADSTVALATLVLGILFWRDLASVPAVLAILFVRALGDTFHWPAMYASTSLMVPKQHLTRIQGLNQTLNGSLRIIAAPMGALLLELIGITGIIIVDVATAIFAIDPLLVIAIPQPERAPSARGLASVWHELREGLHYVRTREALLLLMGTALLANLVLTPAMSLVPILVTSHFRGEALQFAWLQAAMGVGTVTGGLLLSVWGGFQRRVYTTLMGVMGMGLGVTLAGLAPSGLLPVAIVALFLVGTMLPLADGPLHAILQASVAPEMQGRVFMLLGSLASLIAPLGLLVAGPLAELFGVRFWFLTGGIFVLFVGIASTFNRTLLSVEDVPAPSLAPAD